MITAFWLWYKHDIVLVGKDGEGVSRLNTWYWRSWAPKILLGHWSPWIIEWSFISWRKYTVDLLTYTGLMGSKFPTKATFFLNEEKVSSSCWSVTVSLPRSETDMSNHHTARHWICWEHGKPIDAFSLFSPSISHLSLYEAVHGF